MKKTLYESIMKDVSKVIKKLINENVTFNSVNTINNALAELQDDIDNTGLIDLTWPTYASICLSLDVNPFSKRWIAAVKKHFGCDLSYEIHDTERSDLMNLLYELIDKGFDKFSIIKTYLKDELTNSSKTMFLDVLQVALYKACNVVYTLDDLEIVVNVLA